MRDPKRAPAQRTKTPTAALTVRTIRLPTRIRLEYVEQGGPTGTPVLLLHGLADSWRAFEPLLPHLPAFIRAFALSQRGHGDADRPAAGYGPRDFAADLATFMDSIGLRRAVVVGHSMSSMVALRFALDYPDRILALVLVSWRGRPRASAVAATASLSDPIDPTFVREFVVASFAQPPAEAVLDALVQESLKTPARVWRAVLEEFQADDMSAELGKIATPTRVAWGDRDATCPRSDQEALAASIPGARLSVYPGVGHSLHWENPVNFAADLVAVVEQVTAKG